MKSLRQFELTVVGISGAINIKVVATGNPVNKNEIINNPPVALFTPQSKKRKNK